MTRTSLAAAAALIGLGFAGLATAQPAAPSAPHAQDQGRHHGMHDRMHGMHERMHGGGGHGGMGGFMAGQAFARADADQDGRVTLAEGRTWLQARFTEADANRDGGVTIEEVSAFLRAHRNGRATPAAAQAAPEREARQREQLARGFRAVDADGDGKVTFAELQPAAEALFRMADRDTNGALTADEVMRRRAHRQAQPAAQGAPATPR